MTTANRLLVMTADEALFRAAMYRLVREEASEPAMRLAAQLYGFAPCPKCDFLAKHCRCLAREVNPTKGER